MHKLVESHVLKKSYTQGNKISNSLREDEYYDVSSSLQKTELKINTQRN